MDFIKWGGQSAWRDVHLCTEESRNVSEVFLQQLQRSRLGILRRCEPTKRARRGRGEGGARRLALFSSRPRPAPVPPHPRPRYRERVGPLGFGVGVLPRCGARPASLPRAAGKVVAKGARKATCRAAFARRQSVRVVVS